MSTTVVIPTERGNRTVTNISSDNPESMRQFFDHIHQSRFDDNIRRVDLSYGLNATSTLIKALAADAKK